MCVVRNVLGVSMNSPEKKILHLAFCLFVVGLVVRFLPWGLPSIEQNEIADLNIRTFFEVDSSKVEYSNADHGAEVQVEAPRGPKTNGRSPKKKPSVRLPIPINKASADDLCALNGVGPKLAEKIIAFREAHGPFKKPEDLQKVPGIGKKKSEKLLQGVIFD